MNFDFSWKLTCTPPQATLEEIYPEGEYREIFEKNQSWLKWLKHIWIDSVFYADSKSDISFDIDPLFPDENELANSQKTRKNMEKLPFFAQYIPY